MTNRLMSGGRNALTAWTAVFMTALLALTSVPCPAAAQGRGIVILRDAEIETYLRKISIPIYVAAGIEPEAVTMYIVGDPSMNAFVTGGQNMFLNTGLITAAEQPNELIGVIAHETGHMAGGHLVRSSDAASGYYLPAILGMVLGVGAMVAGAPDAGQAVMAAGTSIGQRNVLAYSRVQESAADQAAARYLDATHQSGEGLLAFFSRFRNDEIMTSRDIDPFIQTHPLSGERMSALEDKVESSPFRNVQDPQDEVAALELIKAKIHGFEDRTDAGLRRYPLSNKSAPARYARAVLYYRQGRLDDGLQEINSLIAEQPKNPYFAELKGQMLYESGRATEAVEPYAQAVALAPTMPLIRIGYGQALYGAAEAGHPEMIDKATLELRKALDIDPTISIGWQTLGEAYSTQGKEGLAQLATAELYFNAGNLGGAQAFAARARGKLDKGSIAYNRATDILQVARAQGGGRERN